MLYRIILLSCLYFTTPAMVTSQVPTVVAEGDEEKPIETVKINALRGKETVTVGQQLLYTARVHGSVGYTASLRSSNELDLPLVSVRTEYDDEEKAELSGGDAATKYYIFEAKKAGTYEIHASHYFRGDLENDFTITITVEEQASTINNEETEIVNDKEEAQPDQSKEKIQISERTESVKVGGRLKFSAHVHGSVGISATASSSDSSALPLIKNYIRYRNPIRARRMSGGDSATKHFVFKAKKAGTYTIQIREVFRGELQKETSIVVTVK